MPAAVVCARCGKPDCGGCDELEEVTAGSGVVAIVPWERPGLSGWTRLWLTGKTSTITARGFFASLPAGDTVPALRFAVISELLAIGSVGLILAIAGTALSPGLALAMVTRPILRLLLLRLTLLALPGFAVVLIFGHVVHGLALDLGARREGSRGHLSQATRFGLYSTGWDLMTSPMGVVYTMLTEGLRSGFEVLSVSMRVPSKASQALLGGVYHLDGPKALRARRFGTRIAVACSVVATFVLMVALAVVAVTTRL